MPKKTGPKPSPVPTPKKYAELSEAQKKLWDQVLAKYEPDDVYTILESLIAEDKPITGFEDKITPEYLIRQFLKIAHSSPNDHNRVIALEKVARMKGCFGSNDKRESAEVNISFKEEQPAGWDFKREELQN